MPDGSCSVSHQKGSFPPNFLKMPPSLLVVRRRPRGAEGRRKPDTKRAPPDASEMPAHQRQSRHSFAATVGAHGAACSQVVRKGKAISPQSYGALAMCVFNSSAQPRRITAVISTRCHVSGPHVRLAGVKIFASSYSWSPTLFASSHNRELR